MRRHVTVGPTCDGRWRVVLAGVVATVVEHHAEIAALVPVGWTVEVVADGARARRPDGDVA
jgi:hypothetical protein